MAIVIEAEQKFFSKDCEKLIEILEKNNFILIENTIERDEYFTDKEIEFIVNRTCLRLRKTNNEKMQLTFKGKSKSLLHSYIKKETNVDLPVYEEKDITELLYCLGYYSYSVVEKDRITYSKKENDVTYNVMVDTIKNIGDFIELEIVSDTDKDNEQIQVLLDEYANLFESLNLDIASLPYRDFVALDLYNKITNNYKLDTLYVDSDIVLGEEKLINVELLNKLKELGLEVIIIANDNKDDILIQSFKTITNIHEIEMLKENKKSLLINKDNNIIMANNVEFDKLSRILLILINFIIQ